ncbi:hypothetical protein AVEN_199055-1 [Araneus ventricosus]|uniref:Uncharacterized protein n=1 Tax=Araneus ventricosus TaxID=182803 RepID=A0A4Y2UYY6_ARAVE|nr:hypothetical protein AVEN_199055-1 [Araneus ventricosus]
MHLEEGLYIGAKSQVASTFLQSSSGSSVRMNSTVKGSYVFAVPIDEPPLFKWGIVAISQIGNRKSPGSNTCGPSGTGSNVLPLVYCRSLEREVPAQETSRLLTD